MQCLHDYTNHAEEWGDEGAWYASVDLEQILNFQKTDYEDTYNKGACCFFD